MKKVSSSQIIMIRSAIAKQGIEELKDEMVYEFSNGRTTSTKELHMHEAITLIQHLNGQNPLEKMRKKVFKLAYIAGIIYGETDEDKKMNSAKLDMFLRERGAVKKNLNQLKYFELQKVVNQFEQIVKHTEQSKFNKNVKGLLTELNIKTQ